MLKTKIAILLLLIIQNYQSYSQEILPFAENYTKNDYYGDNQNWDVSSSADGALYFANNHYLLRFDGVKWEKNLLPQKTRIRSVFADQDRIYTGSYKEFGYWLRIEGEMKYFSISKSNFNFCMEKNISLPPLRGKNKDGGSYLSPQPSSLSITSFTISICLNTSLFQNLITLNPFSSSHLSLFAS